MTELNEIPNNWVKTSIGEALIVVLGQSPASSSYNEEGNGEPFFQGKTEFGALYPTVRKWCTEPKKFAKKNSILVSVRAPVGPTNIAPFDCVIGRGLAALQPLADCNTKYFLYLIRNFEKQLAALGTGTTFEAISGDVLKNFQIPLAPVVQQNLIVEKIEELFSHIDAGVEGLKQAKAKLQQYRQSVLKDAVTGKLTEQWRAQNTDKLEPADIVLERILDERRANWEAEQLKAFEEKGKTPKNDKWKEKYKEPPQADLSSLPEIPDSWTWTTITQLGELNRGKSKHRPRNDPSLYGGDYPFVQTGDVRAADGLLTTYKQTYSEKGLSQSRLWPKGTMCITIAANIAETAILDFDACFPDSVVGFISQNEGVSVEYIEFFFRTAREDLDRYAPATAQKNINLAILETVSVPFMSIDEQKEIVLQVTEKLEATNRAEATIDEKIQHSASLKSSILTKAFSGELVPNSCNESAKELLDHIKVEKAALTDTKQKRSTKRKKKVTSGRKPLLTVLNEQSEPLKPDELMQLAGFSSNEVEEFYIELAEIAEQVEQLSPDTEQIKNWPYEKESEIKLKLKG
ncbi:restriction endonuclease subunit S [Photobacterium phosphoreum]|uniref:restriction endonuclease subunit S n=1 Tax=Photobacterium phosphoreum TaxID=659 RepID=UPI001E387AA5|nr:restriction endonuclease subunit S [Photobacterium phosphoreum]